MSTADWGVSNNADGILVKFSGVSTPIFASETAFFKTFVSYFSKLNSRRHLIEFSNFLKFSPIKLGRRSGSFSIATAPTKEKEKIPKKLKKEKIGDTNMEGKPSYLLTLA